MFPGVKNETQLRTEVQLWNLPIDRRIANGSQADLQQTKVTISIRKASFHLFSQP